MRFRFIAFSCPPLLHSLPAGKTLFLCFAVTEPYRGTGPQAPVGSAVPPRYGGQVTSGAVKCSHLSWSDKMLKPQARPSLISFGEKSTGCIAPAVAVIVWPSGVRLSPVHRSRDSHCRVTVFLREDGLLGHPRSEPTGPMGTPCPLKYRYTWDPALAALVLATHGLAFPWGWNGLQLGLLRWYSGQKIQSYLFRMLLCWGVRMGCVWLTRGWG